MTHWKTYRNPDYLGAYALEPGQELILTIKYAHSETVTGPNNRKDECLVIHFEENVKPMIVNATNAKTITAIYKSPYIENWIGKKIQVFATTVKAFGEHVEALRIRQFEPTEKNKRKLNKDEFERMLKAIDSGKLSIEKAISNYSLTPEQNEKLKTLNENT